MIIGYQAKIEAQRKKCQSLQQEHIELSQKLKAANENHQREIEDLREENNESKEEVLKRKNELKESKRDLEETKKDLVNERERVKKYEQKLEVESKAAGDFIKLTFKNAEQQVRKENKSHRKKPSEERWKYGTRKKGVYRLRLTSKPQMPGVVSLFLKSPSGEWSITYKFVK
ncbi:uncharacterized protein LOC141882230 isoform X2 [Acropora palmata]|uniref:uncharacterized protein LOC141882230 isoform X2 n=1 Tax=Acropora palmata TaxID=6131 RepID=UPI003D9FC7C1